MIERYDSFFSPESQRDRKSFFLEAFPSASVVLLGRFQNIFFAGDGEVCVNDANLIFFDITSANISHTVCERNAQKLISHQTSSVKVISPYYTP